MYPKKGPKYHAAGFILALVGLVTFVFMIIGLCEAISKADKHLGSSEAAGWMSTIGSFSAIAGAVWIASAQWRLARRAEKLSALRYASMHGDSFSWTFEELLGLIEQEKAWMNTTEARAMVLKIALKRFESIGQELSGASIGTLEHNDAATFVHLLKLCRTMELAISSLLGDPSSTGVEDIVAILKERGPIAEGWATALRESYISVMNGR